ncbi:hypothetical protein BJ944DRAFT_269353 [Cunninghamella echinulata]|nr:hypothetical protein BJ944DRAFT_269353 [Cunninghamella echinulata]
MIDFENIICSRGIPIKNSGDKYYMSLFEDSGSICVSVYNDNLAGIGHGDCEERGDIFTLEEIDKIWYIMFYDEYMIYDHEDNAINFIKTIPTKDQRLEFHQDENHKSIMTISKWKQPNEYFVIDWIRRSNGWIHIDKNGDPMRFQLVKYNSTKAQKRKPASYGPARNTLLTKFPRRQ